MERNKANIRSLMKKYNGSLTLQLQTEPLKLISGYKHRSLRKYCYQITPKVMNHISFKFNFQFTALLFTQ